MTKKTDPKKKKTTHPWRTHSPGAFARNPVVTSPRELKGARARNRAV